MLVLITYDVNTADKAGRKRLQKIARACVNKGQRVQNSVFECQLDPGQLAELRHEIEQIMDPAVDSLRIYNLGNHYHSRIEHIGAKESYMPDDVLMI